MPVLEGHHNGQQILLPVLIAPPDSIAPVANAIALLDTGASRSLITAELAASLALPRRGKYPLVSARSTELVSRYAFRLGLMIAAEGGGAAPYFLDTDLIGSEFRDHGGFTAIIGMDVIGRGELLLRQDRSYRFTF